MLRGLLWDGVPGIPGCDPGGPSVPHHIQCGGGRSVPTLGSSGGRYIERAGQAWTEGTTPKRPIIRRWRHGKVIRPGMDAGRFQHPSRSVWFSGTVEECQEEYLNVLPSLSGSRHPVGGGIRAADDGREASNCHK